MRNRLIRTAFVVCAFAAAVATSSAATPTTVIIVRHAERPMSESDPSLTPAGNARAAELARVLADSNLTRIYVTKFKRTQETAAPTAAALHLKPVVLETGAAYPTDVVSRIRHDDAGGTVLVVTHSDMIQAILGRFGIHAPPNVPATAFDDLIVVTLADGATPTMVRLRYGAAAR